VAILPVEDSSNNLPSAALGTNAISRSYWYQKADCELRGVKEKGVGVCLHVTLTAHFLIWFSASSNGWVGWYIPLIAVMICKNTNEMSLLGFTLIPPCGRPSLNLFWCQTTTCYLLPLTHSVNTEILSVQHSSPAALVQLKQQTSSDSPARTVCLIKQTTDAG